jgi:RNA polymerase sigma factor (sigma-70 family)
MHAALAEAPMRIVHRRRPGRSEVDPAALELIARHGPQVLATARRYSSTPEDAEDAYQRGLEILLTKAPTTSEDELVPWLKTVVKHEAFAIRRQRERHTPTSDDGELAEPAGAEAATHDQAERLERLHQGAEAMRRLKPQEIRCLLLKAEGYSYREIAEATGFTYTKVNRCLTEGRRAFVDRLAGIEAGSECERLRPLVSLLADGELDAAELGRLRPHLKSCLACRARLAEYRSVAPRVAALVPPAVLVAGGGHGGVLRNAFESLAGAVQDRVAALGERAHAAGELATGQKLAAVAASAAALAGGGATVDQLTGPDGSPPRDQPVMVRPVENEAKQPSRDQPVAIEAPVAETPPAVAPKPTPQEAPAPAPARPAAAAAPAPDPAAEFAPGAAAAPARPSSGGGGEFSPGAGGGGGGGEFSP